MSSVKNLLVEEGTETSALTFQHPCTTHVLLEVKVALQGANTILPRRLLVRE